MKKFVNSVDTVLSESLDGFAAVHADIIALGAERKFVMRRVLNPQKVALVSASNPKWLDLAAEDGFFASIR